MNGFQASPETQEQYSLADYEEALRGIERADAAAPQAVEPLLNSTGE